MQIKYGQALIDGKIEEHVITPSVLKRLEKDLKMKVGSGDSGDTEASMMIWMAFQAAGVHAPSFDAWLETTQATDIRVEEVPLGTGNSASPITGLPSPLLSNPVMDSA